MAKKRKYKKTFNPNLIRGDLSYSVNDIVERLGVHKGTVLAWHKEGLPANDQSKPFLFYGKTLRDFIKTRQDKRKSKCAENEFYCFKCRKVRASRDDFAALQIRDEKHLSISGFCVVCGCKVNKAGALKNIDRLKTIFAVQKIQGRDLLGTGNASATTYLKGARKND
jgi:hypothetical protein